MTVEPAGAPPLGPNPMVVAAEERPARISVKEAGGRLVASGTALRLEIGLDRWGLRFVDADGRNVLADNAGDVDGLGRPAVEPFGVILDGGTPVAVHASFHLGPSERIYGLGEKFTRLDKSGLRIVTWNRDALGATSERSHKNVPFLWSSRGFGLFLATGARVTWDLGVASLRSWSFQAESPALEATIIHGPEPAGILDAYASVTGRAPTPPKWSFGLWLSCGGTYRDQASVEALIDGAVKRRLPLDVIHVDTWWMRWRKYCDFTWDRRAFPDPGRLIRKVHRLGLKLCLWEHPYVSVESRLFAYGKEREHFVRRPDGEVHVIDYGLSLAPRPDGRVRRAADGEAWNAPVAIVDLTNPEAREWFKDLHRPLLRMGVDAFKTDFGEDIPEDARFHDGSTGALMHNLYPLLYNQAVFEVTAEEKGRGIVWSRAGTAGSQRFPVCWSGDPAADFESLAATVRGGLSAGLSGLPFWSHDIGGYRGSPDAELYVRWAQFGLFSSHSRMHGDGPREPWLFGERVLAIVRKYIEWRYRLFPYLYSTALEVRETGLPVIRALPLVFPRDPNAAGWDHEYMFGPAMLVAPVIRRIEELGERGKAPTWPVYLPPGGWVDLWTGRRHRGPRVIEAAAPLETLPVFVRSGSIVPMTAASARIPEEAIDPLWLAVYPGRGSTDYMFFEDAGPTHFRLERDGAGFVLEWMGSAVRRLRIGIAGPDTRHEKGRTGQVKAGIDLPGMTWVDVPGARSGRVRITRSRRVSPT